MAARSSDKLLLGAAGLLAALSAVGFGWLISQQPTADATPVPKVELSAEPYAATAPEAAPVKIVTWAPPSPQSRGREWLYDAFTPPEIFYNPRSKQFTVKPPSSLVDEDTKEEFGIELVAVRPEPFRLQLIGYVGGEGNWRGMFQNTMSGEVFLAAAGRRVPNLGVSIKRFEVTPHPITPPESMTTRQLVATAVVHEERSGRDVTLTHRDRVFTGTVFAFVAATGQPATREVRTGDAFKQGPATYRVEKIQLTPPTIEITKESPSLSQPERRVLSPRETENAETPDAPPAPL